MKKISFGSFPFINIDRKTRTCLDKYLIKTFADQIVITDIFSNLNSAKDFFYLTPEVIIDQLYNFGKAGETGDVRTGNIKTTGMVTTRGYQDFNKKGNGKFESTVFNPIKNISKLIMDNDYLIFENDNVLLEEIENDKFMKTKDPYMDILRRGFFILRNFYKKVSNDPFYRDIVYLPVYSEKMEVLNPSNINDSQYKYSFFLLANDLTKNLKLDEVSFNDSVVINAIYIFTQLFPGKKLTDFNDKDLDKLLRVYKFFEEYKLSPIEFFTMLYRIFYIFSEAKNLEEAKSIIIKASKKPPFNQIFNDSVVKALLEVLADFRKNDFDETFKFLKSMNIKYNVEMTRKNTEKFWYIIETILKNRNIMSLISNTSKTYADRVRTFNQNFKFRDMILLFEELVNYNKYSTNDIIKDTNFGLNFKLELNNETVSFNEQIIKKKLDSTFANFLSDADDYIINLFKKKIDELNSNQNKSILALLGAAESRKNVDNNLARYNKLERELKDVQVRMAQVRMSDPNEFNRLQMVYNSISNEMAMVTPSINNDIITSNIMQAADAETNRKYAESLERDVQNLTPRINALRDQMERTDDMFEKERLRAELENYNKIYAENMQKINELRAASDGVSQFGKITGAGKSDIIFTNFSLKDAKTELGELYQTLKNFLMNQNSFNIFIKLVERNNDLVTVDGFKKFLENNNYQTDEAERLAMDFKDIDMALKDVAEVLSEEFMQKLEAQMLNKAMNKGIDNNYFDKIIQNIKTTLFKFQDIKKVIRDRLLRILCLRVLKVFTTAFKRNLEKGEISFNETTYGLHPMIKQLLRNPNNFKSFIFGYEELNSLYDLLYITDVEKYLMQSATSMNFGTAQRAPLKLTQTINKFNHVIEVLGIKENPLWIISRSDIYLSLPDFMSLTRERIFNSIKKDDIQSYCRINYSKIWHEMDFGSTFGGQTKEFKQKITQVEKKLRDIRTQIKNEEKKLKDKKHKSEHGQIKKKIVLLKKEEDYLLTSLKALTSTMSLFGNQNNNIKLGSIPEYL